MTDQEFLKALCTPAPKSDPEIELKIQEVCNPTVTSRGLRMYNIFRPIAEEETEFSNLLKQKFVSFFNPVAPDYVYNQNAGIDKRKSSDTSKEELPFPILKAFIETEEIKQLKDVSSFKEDAKRMGQKVKFYIGAAINGYFIYHIKAENNQHGTMIVDDCGEILSIFGPNNSTPSVEVLVAIAKWIGLLVHDFTQSEEYIKYVRLLSDDDKSKCANTWDAYVHGNHS